MYIIDIKDIVGNALIEIIERTGKRYILFSKLDNYINAITAQTKDIIINFNRNDTNKFFYDYAYMFDINEFVYDTCVTLKNNFSTDDLRKYFRRNLSLEMLKIFTSKQSIESLINE